MRYTDDAAILLAAALAGEGGGGGSAGLRIQVANDTVVDDWDVPNMTVADVTVAHNTLANGKAVSIVNAAGEVTFTAFLADISTGKPCITIAYYWLGFVDYQVTSSNTVAITVHSIENVNAKSQTVTIAVADWSGGTTCTKSVTGVTATNIVIVDTSDGNVECTGQGAGTLTFTAISTPTSAVTVKVVIL